jgi:acetyl-CoA carboxylase carboxyl transferase subunit alpha
MTRRYVMEFERPLVELEDKLAELRKLDLADNPELVAEVDELAAQIERCGRDLRRLSAVGEGAGQPSSRPPQDAGLPRRALHDVIELHGDRTYGDDEAILAALATIEGRRKVAVLGHRKGKNTRENIARNFGMVHPEGFRKAMRVMRLPTSFGLPLVTFVDTPGRIRASRPRSAARHGRSPSRSRCSQGFGARRGVGIGEGGSGGALAIGFGDRSSCSRTPTTRSSAPRRARRSCTRTPARRPTVAGCLAMTAEDLIDLGIADEIVPEPLRRGAHAAGRSLRRGARRVVAALDASFRRVRPASLRRATSGCAPSASSGRTRVSTTRDLHGDDRRCWAWHDQSYQASVGMLFSGGPAPAANAVISAAALSFINSGISGLRIPRWLREPRAVLDPDRPLVEGRALPVPARNDVSQIRNRKDIVLRTSRANPGKDIARRSTI